MATVVLVGTLDTKGQEYDFLCDRVREHDVEVLLVDCGIMGEPHAMPDISREEVASAVGVDVHSLAVSGDRGAAARPMTRGGGRAASRLSARGRRPGRP